MNDLKYFSCILIGAGVGSMASEMMFGKLASMSFNGKEMNAFMSGFMFTLTLPFYPLMRAAGVLTVKDCPLPNYLINDVE